MGSSQSKPPQQLPPLPPSPALGPPPPPPQPVYSKTQGVNENDTYHIATNSDPKMCLSYGNSGINVKVVECQDVPEQKWAFLSVNAIKQAAESSGNAGSEVIGDDEDGDAGNEMIDDSQPQPQPQDTNNEQFKGYITRKGMGFHVNFVDLLCIGIIGYLLFRFFKK